MEVGVLVKLSHLDKREQVAIFKVVVVVVVVVVVLVDSRSNLQNRWSCLRSHRQYSAGRPCYRRSALDRLLIGSEDEIMGEFDGD